MSATGIKQHVAAMILGEVASSGLSRGRALLCDCASQAVVARRRVAEKEVHRELNRFDEAVSASEKRLLKIQKNVRLNLGDGEAEIFEAQILIMRDAKLRSTVRDLCLTERLNVEAAVDEAIKRLMALFERIADPYFRERAADLRDVRSRLLEHLAENPQPSAPNLVDGCVLITTELLSSAVAQLEGRGVRGLIVETGSLTAHATILARALGIPMLIHMEDATKKIRPGELLIIDALGGRVFVNPNSEILGKYDQLESDLHAHQTALKGLIDLPALTQDGTTIRLSANIGQAADAVTASHVKADGAGLYRTEFVFLVQDHFPSEEEQYQIYRATAEHLLPNDTIIRILDIGSDKPLAYFPLPHEANPALGCRGTRLLLAHPSILRDQLRAILRLSASHPVSILLPMIGGMDDLREAKAGIESAKAELVKEGHLFNPLISVGAMIETPSAAILVAQLAGEVDFFSVGTNDLVQYLLVADRMNGGTTSSYEPMHAAVLHVLNSVATAAKASGKPICVCGELSSDPAFTSLLLGLGFRSFSVSPGSLLEIKYAIRSTSLPEAEALARKALSLNCVSEIKAHLHEDWNRRRPVSSPATT